MALCKMLHYLIALCLGVNAKMDCDTSITKAMKISITNQRNLTGHWIAQVQLEHAGGDKETGPWDVNIEHTTRTCQGIETVDLKATVIAPPAKSILTAGPEGYDLVPGLGYYKLHTDMKTWEEALIACEAEGAHLLIINSDQEAKALEIFWDVNPKINDRPLNDWAHVGFHDKYKEGQYLTIFNESLVSTGYVKWYPGDPQGEVQDCGMVARKSNLLADVECNIKIPYFCELEQ
ncbi:hypothetical protein L9F63_016489 [Diploptera punctata]|uniref:C-type lectin domain-containing protein n=1 Tax=Diploptera punctata TaxID=6984 RepID=A0AAD8EHG8_DIPPU|nr:hypothetical protein L9F63_016489 [Diploptera punctata]